MEVPRRKRFKSDVVPSGNREPFQTEQHGRAHSSATLVAAGSGASSCSWFDSSANARTLNRSFSTLSQDLLGVIEEDMQQSIEIHDVEVVSDSDGSDGVEALQANPVDLDADMEVQTHDFADEKESLQNMALVLSTWLAQVDANPYTETLLQDTETLATDTILAMTALEEKTPDQVVQIMTELRDRFQELRAIFERMQANTPASPRATNEGMDSSDSAE